MATEKQTQNPFENEQPKLVHLEKDESHYEYCRMQMHDIEKVHRRTCLVNLAICLVVCFLAIFRVYITGFGSISSAMMDGAEGAGAVLAAGMCQIIISMVVMLVGYLAWANFHTLNIFLEGWYLIVTLIAIFKLDYLSALVGVVGLVFYFFSIKEMRHEETLAQMEGYPDFREKFDISKSDIVIQTLLAHKGERRTKSTLFTTDYSLRKKRKKNVLPPVDAEAPADAGAALAEELQSKIDAVKQTEADQETTAETPDEAPEKPAERTPEEEAAAIIAEAEAKAKAILAEAQSSKAANEAKAPAEPAEGAAEAVKEPVKPAAEKPQNQGGKKKKKKR